MMMKYTFDKNSYAFHQGRSNVLQESILTEDLDDTPTFEVPLKTLLYFFGPSNRH